MTCTEDNIFTIKIHTYSFKYLTFITTYDYEIEKHIITFVLPNNHFCTQNEIFTISI